MGKQLLLAAYVTAMIAIIVGVDVLLFRHHFWPRLMANVGIVLLFGACYFRFMKSAN
jgi:predicted cobalt transporter CbtA